MADPPQPDPPLNDDSEGMDFAALANAPVASLGLPERDADALEQALGVRTVRDLAENKYVRRAQANRYLANGNK